VDHYGFKVRSDSTSYAKFYSKEELIMYNHEVLAKEGLFKFQNLSITNLPGNTSDLFIETNGIPKFMMKAHVNDKIYSGADGEEDGEEGASERRELTEEEDKAATAESENDARRIDEQLKIKAFDTPIPA
jgi:hypothetical protein